MALESLEHIAAYVKAEEDNFGQNFVAIHADYRKTHDKLQTLDDQNPEYNALNERCLDNIAGMSESFVDRAAAILVRKAVAYRAIECKELTPLEILRVIRRNFEVFNTEQFDEDLRWYETELDQARKLGVPRARPLSNIYFRAKQLIDRMMTEHKQDQTPVSTVDIKTMKVM